MTHLAQIARNLTGQRLFMADLAQSVYNIVEQYGASGALIQQVRANFDENIVTLLEPDWEFSLPIRRHRKWKSDSLKNVYSTGSSQSESILRSEIRKFVENVLCDHSLLLSGKLSRHACGHMCKIDVNSKSIVHLIYLEIDSNQDETIIFDVIAIYEEYLNISNTLIFKGYSYNIVKCHEDSLAKHFVNFRHFREREGIFKNADANKGGDSDIDPAMLFSLFLNNKIRANSFVSGGLMKHCWTSALETGSRVTDLPWEIGTPPGAQVPTATLSVDLRKSTSLMDLVEDREFFAVWLESLSEICRSIVHDNDGIFDKFTGDGVIAHFATNEVGLVSDETGREIDPQGASLTLSINRAFVCGCELIRALEVHLDALRPRLRFNIVTAGPSVGMAFDDASWSLDRDGRPIVVGKGVVNACRLTDGDSGWLQMAYYMKRHLDAKVLNEVDKRLLPFVLVKHKDLRPDLKPECYLASDVNFDLGRTRVELASEVERISRQVDKEHRDRVRLLTGSRE